MCYVLQIILWWPFSSQTDMETVQKYVSLCFLPWEVGVSEYLGFITNSYGEVHGKRKIVDNKSQASARKNNDKSQSSPCNRAPRSWVSQNSDNSKHHRKECKFLCLQRRSGKVQKKKRTSWCVYDLSESEINYSNLDTVQRPAENNVLKPQPWNPCYIQGWTWEQALFNLNDPCAHELSIFHIDNIIFHNCGILAKNMKGKEYSCECFRNSIWLYITVKEQKCSHFPISIMSKHEKPSSSICPTAYKYKTPNTLARL